MKTDWIPPRTDAPLQLLGAMRAESSGVLDFMVPAHAMACLTVVHVGAILVRTANGQWQDIGPSFASGSFREAVQVRALDGTVWTSLFCRADAWPCLTGRSARHFADRFFPSDLLTPSSPRLRDELEALTGGQAEWRDAATVLPRLLHALGQDLAASVKRGATALLNQVLPALADQDLAVVQQQLHVSERRLQRVFESELGLSAKRIERLARLNRAVRVWDNGEAGLRSIADLAAFAGYADQSHLAREFKLLVGEPPVQLKAGPEERVLWALREGGRMLAPGIFQSNS